MLHLLHLITEGMSIRKGALSETGVDNNDKGRPRGTLLHSRILRAHRRKASHASVVATGSSNNGLNSVVHDETLHRPSSQNRRRNPGNDSVGDIGPSNNGLHSSRPKSAIRVVHRDKTIHRPSSQNRRQNPGNDSVADDTGPSNNELLSSRPKSAISVVHDDKTLGRPIFQNRRRKPINASVAVPCYNEPVFDMNRLRARSATKSFPVLGKHNKTQTHKTLPGANKGKYHKTDANATNTDRTEKATIREVKDDVCKHPDCSSCVHEYLARLYGDDPSPEVNSYREHIKNHVTKRIDEEHHGIRQELSGLIALKFVKRKYKKVKRSISKKSKEPKTKESLTKAGVTKMGESKDEAATRQTRVVEVKMNHAQLIRAEANRKAIKKNAERERLKTLPWTRKLTTKKDTSNKSVQHKSNVKKNDTKMPMEVQKKQLPQDKIESKANTFSSKSIQTNAQEKLEKNLPGSTNSKSTPLGHKKSKAKKHSSPNKTKGEKPMILAAKFSNKQPAAKSDVNKQSKVKETPSNVLKDAIQRTMKSVQSQLNPTKRRTNTAIADTSTKPVSVHGTDDDSSTLLRGISETSIQSHIWFSSDESSTPQRLSSTDYMFSKTDAMENVNDYLDNIEPEYFRPIDNYINESDTDTDLPTERVNLQSSDTQSVNYAKLEHEYHRLQRMKARRTYNGPALRCKGRAGDEAHDFPITLPFEPPLVCSVEDEMSRYYQRRETTLSSGTGLPIDTSVSLTHEPAVVCSKESLQREMCGKDSKSGVCKQDSTYTLYTWEGKHSWRQYKERESKKSQPLRCQDELRCRSLYDTVPKSAVTTVNIRTMPTLRGRQSSHYRTNSHMDKDPALAYTDRRRSADIRFDTAPAFGHCGGSRDKTAGSCYRHKTSDHVAPIPSADSIPDTRRIPTASKAHQYVVNSLAMSPSDDDTSYSGVTDVLATEKIRRENELEGIEGGGKTVYSCCNHKTADHVTPNSSVDNIPDT